MGFTEGETWLEFSSVGECSLKILVFSIWHTSGVFSRDSLSVAPSSELKSIGGNASVFELVLFFVLSSSTESLRSFSKSFLNWTRSLTFSGLLFSLFFKRDFPGFMRFFFSVVVDPSFPLSESLCEDMRIHSATNGSELCEEVCSSSSSVPCDEISITSKLFSSVSTCLVSFRSASTKSSSFVSDKTSSEIVQLTSDLEFTKASDSCFFRSETRASSLLACLVSPNGAISP